MLNRRAFAAFAASVAALSAALAFAAPAQAADAAPTGTPVARNVVLVHGLFADGSSWGKVIPILQRAGLHVTAVQNPLSSFQDDVDATKRVLALQDGPTVLVAHSYGGMVISQAGNDPKVSSLVYIAARAPDAGEDYAALARKYPTPPASAGVVWGADGFGQLSEEAFVHDFAGDLPPDEARAYWAVQGRMSRATPAATTTVAAWHFKPTYYAVSANDRTIDPDLERFMAHRMGADTIELPASHVALLSQPQEVAALIISAAYGRK